MSAMTTVELLNASPTKEEKSHAPADTQDWSFQITSVVMYQLGGGEVIGVHGTVVFLPTLQNPKQSQ